MRAYAPKKKKKNFMLRFAFAAFALYVVFQIVALRIQLHDKEQLLEQTDAQIQHQQLINEDLQDQVNNTDTNLEKEARDQGYSLPGEQIYKIAAEN